MHKLTVMFIEGLQITVMFIEGLQITVMFIEGLQTTTNSAFMILVTSSFSLHCYYVYNFENYYWILHIKYQFTITFRKILLNTIQNKRIN